MKSLVSTQRPFAGVSLRFALAAAVLLVLAITSAQAHWPNTNATKWVQFPDHTTNGLDVLAAKASPTAQPLILASDFQCIKAGPITDIHIWASWLGDIQNCNLPITLAIWNDTPAVPPTQPSHPGTARLWSQTFLPGQYTAKIWKTAKEQFWNPEGGIIGNDTLIWQYNFYPTNPFVQQGSPNLPVVYWLSVTAGTNTAMFGWKTTTNHWNDDAVFGHLDPQGNPLHDWQELRDPRSAANGRSLDLAFALTTPQVFTNPPPITNKWLQLPDTNGLDVRITWPKILADDFLCKAAGRLTNIQIWASCYQDMTPDPNTRFELSIWDDVPAGATSSGTVTNFSHPGQRLWSETFLPGNYTLASAGTGNEQFYDPNTGQLTPETRIWKYNFNPKKPYCQSGSTNIPKVYWLAVWARTTNNPNFLVGWKTSTNHWNDDAVFGHVNAAGAPVRDWKDLHDPRTGMNKVSLDLAFLINNGPPSADCDPNLNAKYVQWPDTSTNGLDVKATVTKILADDFPCRRTGRINGITVWGSWKEDKVDPNATFQLSLWTDFPKQPVPGSFSHPGQLLCTQTFYPPTSTVASLPRYKASLAVSNVQERFYDPNIPGTAGLIGNDTQIWRYDFYPTTNCWYQDGSSAAQKVYWVSVTATTADTNQFLFGWKTSTNHWNDDGVYGHVGAGGVPLNDWKELRDPRNTNISLDLSFAIRTFPVVSVNKDIININPAPATGVRYVVAGHHEITKTYDGTPPWPNVQISHAGGNTRVEWSGMSLAHGQMTHTGFEMAGSAVSLIEASLVNGSTVIGPVIQANYRVLGGNTLVLDNDINSGPGFYGPGTVEYHAGPVDLDQMNPQGNRNPLASHVVITSTIPFPCFSARASLPRPPAGAQYALFSLQLYSPQQEPATWDFVQVPLFEGMAQKPDLRQPTVMAMGADSFFDVFFDVPLSEFPGSRFGLQSAGDVNGPFSDRQDVESPPELIRDPDGKFSAPDGLDPDTELPAFMIPMGPADGMQFYRGFSEPP